MPKQCFRRKLSNVKLTQKYHVQYTAWWLVVCSINVIVLGAAVTMLYDQLQANLVSQEVDRSLELIASSLQAKALIIVMSLLYSGAILALAVFTAHRLAGPYLALIRTFEAVTAGQLESRLKFRGYDRLEDVEDAFNEMMDELTRRVTATENDSDEDTSPLIRMAS